MAKNLEELRKRANLTPDRLAQVDAEVRAEVTKLRLADIRRARHLTQHQLASNMDVAQGDVSRLEHRTDTYVSTLRSYIEAMGGTLRIVAEFPGSEAVEIAGFAEPGEGHAAFIEAIGAKGTPAVRDTVRGTVQTRRTRAR